MNTGRGCGRVPFHFGGFLMVWMYHKDCPKGRVFESAKDAPRGWVDSPAKIKGKAKDGNGS